MLLFPPLVFANFIVNKREFGTLLVLQLLGVLLLSGGAVMQYPEVVREYTGLDLGTLFSEEPALNRVVRTKKHEDNISLPVNKKSQSRSDKDADSLNSFSTTERQNHSSQNIDNLDISDSIGESFMPETANVELIPLSGEEEIGESALGRKDESEPGEKANSTDALSTSDNVFWVDDEEDESMSMGGSIDITGVDIQPEVDERVGLSQAVQNDLQPQIVQETIATDESQVSTQTVLMEQAVQNIIEPKFEKIPAYILEERERVKEKQAAMEVIAEWLSPKVGKMITVVKKDGKTEVGKLTRVSNKNITLEKRIGAGVMENFIKLEDIDEAGEAE
ncbi:MAG: hypothetical protein JKY01_13215 [Pseudomonadales bacterium]|nr:hypothetical protein [Pseudomonadales bacterium]